jgi:hypothetical protein
LVGDLPFSDSISQFLLPATFKHVTNMLFLYWKYYSSVFFSYFIVKFILSAFAKFAKVILSFVMSLCSSVCMEQLGSHSKDFN